LEFLLVLIFDIKCKRLKFSQRIGLKEALTIEPSVCCYKGYHNGVMEWILSV